MKQWCCAWSAFSRWYGDGGAQKKALKAFQPALPIFSLAAKGAEETPVPLKSHSAPAESRAIRSALPAPLLAPGETRAGQAPPPWAPGMRPRRIGAALIPPVPG